MKETESGCEWITAEEAAQQLETTPLRVLMLVKKGVLCGREADGAWEVDRRSLDGAKGTSIENIPQGGHTCGGCRACS